jgi:branched-chain amino acid transport system permease protein
MAQTRHGDLLVPARSGPGSWRAREWATAILLAAMLALPLVAWWAGQKFYLDLSTRMVILTLAAVSLNLVLGYGGMISFGHAAFVGIGAYGVGILAFHGIGSGLAHFPLAVAVCALFALATGAICLRTKGVYFIMITMAFAQMAYYFFLSLEVYGGDDGLAIFNRSTLPLLTLQDPLRLFLFAYASLLVGLYLKHRIVNSRFGLVMQGAKDNDTRMRTLGYNTYAYRLFAYVISGAMAGYAGALLGNFTSYVSPAMMSWTRSGELIFMVILGGAGSLFGPVFGAIGFLVLEEYLSTITTYWQLPFGLLLIAAVLFVRGGAWGLLTRLGARP